MEEEREQAEMLERENGKEKMKEKHRERWAETTKWRDVGGTQESTAVTDQADHTETQHTFARSSSLLISLIAHSSSWEFTSPFMPAATSGDRV